MTVRHKALRVNHQLGVATQASDGSDSLRGFGPQRAAWRDNRDLHRRIICTRPRARKGLDRFRPIKPIVRKRESRPSPKNVRA
jgi:hypothetical protein